MPAAWPRRTKPASIASAPAPVTSRPCSAARRAAAFSCEYPMRRNDVRVVSSQKTNSAMRLSAVTTPSIASMKPARNSVNRPRCGYPRMYSPAKSRMNVPIPVISSAKSRPRPSTAKSRSTPCSGSQASSRTRVSPRETAGTIVQNQTKSAAGRAGARRRWSGVPAPGPRPSIIGNRSSSDSPARARRRPPRARDRSRIAPREPVFGSARRVPRSGAASGRARL